MRKLQKLVNFDIRVPYRFTFVFHEPVKPTVPTPCEHRWTRLHPSSSVGRSEYCHKCKDYRFVKTPRCRCDRKRGREVHVRMPGTDYTGLYRVAFVPLGIQDGLCDDCGEIVSGHEEEVYDYMGMPSEDNESDGWKSSDW
jgi:hypothetical protein